MKMNFKYAMMACVGLAMGFASCSDNESIDTNEPVEGAKAYAQVNLKFEGAKTRADHTLYLDTPEEYEIYSAKIYVFNSNKVLQQIVPYEFLKDAANVDQCRFETTEGMHYFLAVANAPEFDIPLGIHIDAMDQYIQGIDKAKFATYVDPYDASITTPPVNGGLANTRGAGFFMTSGVDVDDLTYSKIEYSSKLIEAATEQEIIDDINDKKNFVEIFIGRAMARVEAFVALNDADDLDHDSKANGRVEFKDIRYGLANNPDVMHFFPYFGGENLFQSPFHYLFNTTNLPDNYWPSLYNTDEFPVDGNTANYTTPNYMNGNGKLVKFKDLSDPTQGVEELADQSYKSYLPKYAVENSNKVPTYGDATLLSVKAVFKPSFIVASGAIDAGTGEPTTTPNSNVVTFIRIRTNELLLGRTSKYVDEYFFADVDDAQIYADKKLGLATTEYELVTYKNGVCYYIVPLYNYKKGTPECYDVVRNHYFEVKINEIIACGYNEPGCDKDTEKKDPLDPTNPFMHATITVKDWVKVEQSEGLKPRN